MRFCRQRARGALRRPRQDYSPATGRQRVGTELTGILKGTGAKMKADIGEGVVAFRGQWKGDVPFSEIIAEARGTLLVLAFRGHIVEVSAGSNAAKIAARIRKGA